MTRHALDRCAERIPEMEAEAALDFIASVVANSDPLATDVVGQHVFDVELPSGRVVFPIVSDKGKIVTILEEGMSVATPKERITLHAHLRPGLHDISATRYHADPCARPSLSSGVARTLLAKSPLHAWTAHPRLNPSFEPTEKKSFDIGRAAHTLTLGRGQGIAVYPDDVLAANGAASTKAAKAWEAETRAAGRVPLKSDEAAQLHEMWTVLSGALDEFGIAIDPDRSELTAIGEIDGVLCRAMIDNAPEDPALPLYDFKTCEEASPQACIRAVARYGYDVQAAHYLAVWEAVTGEKRSLQFIFQEKAPPYEVGVVTLCDRRSDEADWMEDARGKAAEARRLWKTCLETDHWPGYPRVVGEIGAPGWHRDAWSKYGTGTQDAALAHRPKRPSPEAIRNARLFQAPEGFEL